jgi:toxin-antitoxin system PIN domain toxin
MTCDHPGRQPPHLRHRWRQRSPARRENLAQERPIRTETVGFPWRSLLGFLRITTNARILPTPIPSGTALDIVDGWLSQPISTVVHPTHRHAAVLRDLVVYAGLAGDLIPDAHLAALAIEHGATLHSADSDFARFPALKWHNPLA